MEYFDIIDTYEETTAPQSIDGLYLSELAADGGTTRRPLELDLVEMEEDSSNMLRKPMVASADDSSGGTRRPL